MPDSVIAMLLAYHLAGTVLCMALMWEMTKTNHWFDPMIALGWPAWVIAGIARVIARMIWRAVA